jgi:proteasome lid subunit RPN8/RPN11
VIEIPAKLFERIRRHGAETYPEECCGGLLGERRDGVVIVRRVERVPNRGAERRERRYAMDPKDYLGLERSAGEVGLAVVGIYHSHPDHPAVPSDFDREHAWPYFHYLIVAVEGGRASDVACWILKEDRGSFERAPHRVRAGDAEED